MRRVSFRVRNPRTKTLPSGIPLSTSTQPFLLFRVMNAGAIVFASPHSGRVYPPELLSLTGLPAAELRRGEDRFVDKLLDGVSGSGVPRILAQMARAWIDLNRDPAELDPELFDSVPPDARVSARVSAGLGIVPRAFAPGMPIYRERLSLTDGRARIEAVHVPYHAAVAALLDEARARHGFAVLIDCHSMPSQGGARVVVGDLNGQSASAAVAGAVADALGAVGLSVARNDPYAGAYTLERHGQPACGVHAVQLEFDRALYLDAEGGTLLPGAARLADNITRFAACLALRLSELRMATPWAMAAE